MNAQCFRGSSCVPKKTLTSISSFLGFGFSLSIPRINGKSLGRFMNDACDARFLNKSFPLNRILSLGVKDQRIAIILPGLMAFADEFIIAGGQSGYQYKAHKDRSTGCYRHGSLPRLLRLYGMSPIPSTRSYPFPGS